MSEFVNAVYENIWKDRYQKNEESFEDQLNRVANFIAQAEKEKDRDYWAKEFYSLMYNKKFFPAGRTMSNAGIGEKLTLNNCFVAPIIQDSMEGIFNTVKLGAITHKAGGGIGYQFSNLSPRGKQTRNDAIASGPVSFMDVFNAQTSTVQQGSRRGANMGILSVYHPDINEFLEAKSYNTERLQYFNLSVMVDDAFMEAVVNDRSILLHWPIYDEQGNHVRKESWDKQFTKEVKAKELWNKIISLAYDNGEPGIFFETNMQKYNPAYYIENIVCTNPCSEYLAGTLKVINPMDYGGACNLGSIFLHNFVENPFTKQAKLNEEELKKTIKIAVRLLDDIIDVNKFPDKIYENYQKNMRTIGLGFTGLADALAMLGMRYNSKQAIKYVDHLIKNCTQIAYEASISLAKEKGAFPFCDKNKHANSLFCKQNLEEYTRKEIEYFGIRNAKIMSVAPCGTLSLTFGNNCSSGIEPIFSLTYDRKVKIGGQDDSNVQVVKMMDYAYYLYNTMKEQGRYLDYKEEDIFITAQEMSVDEHIEMLAAIAKHIDMSVSKTINVPTDYPYEKTKNIYLNCWKKGIKGCTIFRPNPIRSGILMDNKSTVNNCRKDDVSNKTTLKRGDIIDCNNNLIGKKRKIVSGCGPLHILAYFDPDTADLMEVYLNKGSEGGCALYMTGLSRMISLACRAGVNIMDIKDQLDSTGTCPSYAVRKATKHDTSKGSCCPMAIGNALVDMWKEMKEEIDDDWEDEKESQDQLTESTNQIIKNSDAVCPECGEPLVFEGGCNTCKNCGYSKCN